MNFLKLIGAVSAAEHEKIVGQRDGLKRDLLAERLKFKNAAKDLAAQADEIAAIRPDAEKWRDRAARELQRGQAKRDAALRVARPLTAPTKGASK